VRAGNHKDIEESWKVNINLNTGYGTCLESLARQLLATIIIITITAVLSQAAIAYDGDVDYNAPYLTVDPETGKLVTIDPKAQTKTPHPTTAPTSTSQTQSTTVDTPPTQTGQVMTQTSAANAGMAPTGQPESTAGTGLPVIAGIVVSLIVVSFLLFSKRKKAAVTSTSDTSDS
jgi:cobalamin biosynthesis Mg chelatase CobN